MLVRLERENWWNATFDILVIGINDAYCEVNK